MRLAFLGIAATLLACDISGGPTAHAAPPGERRAVVVELFSSEGCSSCPPADAVLRDLATKQPVAGAEVIALEMHVDYWNDLGWADPFSKAAFTDRQRGYAGTLAPGRGVYTPQMIVDGETGFVGSQSDAAKAAIGAAAAHPKAKVLLQRVGEKVTIAVTDLPSPNEPADVWLALTESGLSTAVPRGENAGATLAHGPIVRRLDRVGSASGASFSIEAPLRLDPAWSEPNIRAVAFVQRKKTQHIVGAAAIAVKKVR